MVVSRFPCTKRKHEPLWNSPPPPSFMSLQRAWFVLWASPSSYQIPLMRYHTWWGPHLSNPTPYIAPLPWSIITLFIRNPPILRVMTSALSCGCIVSSRSSSSKVIFFLLDFSFFLGWSIASCSYWGVMLSIPFRHLVLTLIDVAYMTSIMLRGGGISPPQIFDAYPIVLPI